MDIEAIHTKTIFDKCEEQWEHVPYNIELSFLERVKHGDPEALENNLPHTFPRHNGHLSDDPYRQAMYEFVACTTLVTRFAIEGGLRTELAYSLSDAYIKLADKLCSPKPVYQLFYKMMIDFATHVKQAKKSAKSLGLPIAHAMAYIDSNLHNKITLDVLSLAIDRSPAYISSQFKAETGMSITKYINEQKIEEAKRLFRDGNMSISSVSATLAFGSQSYFSKIFLDIVGETPGEYRRKHFTKHNVEG